MDNYYNEYKNRMAILDEVIDYLNDHYNQASEAYNLFLGVKPQIVEYNDSAVISFWACGAIVKINDVLHFVSEDDGNWFISKIGHSFHIGWSDSYIDAIQTLKNYTQKKCSECQNQENQ